MTAVELVAWAPRAELARWLADGWRLCRGALAMRHAGHRAYSVLVWREAAS